MSSDSSDGVLSDPEGDPAAAGPQGHGSPAAVLELCDRELGEVGRRQHRFGWLRAPEPGAEQWLPVDAYYPRRRVVVVCRALTPAEDAVLAEAVPAHGLALLRLGPDDLGGHGEAPARRIRDLVSDMRLPERRIPPLPP